MMSPKRISRAAVWLLAGALLAAAGCAGEEESAGGAPEARAAVRAIRRVLDAQVAAWNRGDIEDFMQGYAHTDSLRFASGGEVRLGWQAALSSYRTGYPDREAMGTLAFSDLDIEVLSADRALVFGRWRLQRAADTPHGLFTLIFARRPTAAGDTAWRIVHDHTSAAE